MRIWLDPDRLTELNLTPNDVISAVQSQNIQAALGRVGAAPITNEQQVQITIKTKGRLTRPGGIRRHRPARQSRWFGCPGEGRCPRRNGRKIAGPLQPLQWRTCGRDRHLPDARVQCGRGGPSGSRNHEHAGRSAFPHDLAYTVFFDSTVFVTATIDEVIRTLAIAIILVAVVVFLFLGKVANDADPAGCRAGVDHRHVRRHAVIGYSANTVSLLALVLAIGIVVDDAIVVVENVERVMEENPELPVPEACKKAMAEITGPILAITLVLLSVFVPVAFIPGISGQLFRQFAVAVSVSMLISALNALTLSPALCAVLLKHGQASSGPMRYVLRGIDRARDGYVAVVRRLVRVAIVGVVVVAGTLAASVWLFSKTPQSFLPDEDQGAIFAALRLPEGVSLNRTEDGGQAGRRHRQADPGRRRRVVGGRAEFHRLHPVGEPGLLRHPAQALRDAH